MGARAQVHIKETGVYLYTHWGSGSLLNNVATALSKKWRWDDISYLTRIIFDQMVGEEQGTETGFGIDNLSAGDAEFTIHILPGNNIKVDGDKEWEGSFKGFIKRYLKD